MSQQSPSHPVHGPPAQPPANALPTVGQVLRLLTSRVWVTPLLVAANVGVFIVMAAAGVSVLMPDPSRMIEWGANFGPRTLGGEWWRILTSTFLHFGIIHLALNMIVLAQVGGLVERLIGSLGFLLLYLVSGVLGSLASVFSNPEVVSAGASGSVFGVVGGLLGFLTVQRHALPREALVPLAKNAGFFVVVNLAFGFVAPGIDVAAHVGGLAGGFLCGLLLSRPRTGEQGV